MSEPIYAELDVAAVHPSPFQPRKTFNEKKLQELAVSIAERGVQQPIKVRPNKKGHEIIFGERRWRASEIAGKKTIPALIVEMADVEVREAQLVENSQREDVHPIEEADGYRALLDQHGYTIDTLVARIGKSRSHLYGRLKLLDLIPAARKACLDGKLAPACAELVARVDPKVQPEFLKDALGEGEYETYEDSNIECETVATEDHKVTPQPLSFRALQQLMHRKYTLRLAEAPFLVDDARLVPAAGACTTCPHRTGGQPDLFPDLKKPADSCTKPTCFDSKVKAHWAERVESAKAMGHKVVVSKDAKGTIDYSGKPTFASKYAALDQPLPYDVAKPGSNATFKQMLGKLEAQVPKVLVQDERGGAHLVLDKDAAIKVLREAGKLDEAKKKPASTWNSSADAEYKKEAAKNKEKRELRSEAFKRVLEDLGAGAKDFDFGNARKTTALVRMLAMQTLERANLYDDVEDLLEPIYGAKPNLQDAIENAIVEAKGPGALLAIMITIVAADMRDAIVGDYPGGDKKIFDELCTLFGADWKDAQDRAKTASKVEAKADAAKDKAKPAAAAKPAKPAKKTKK